MRNGIYVLKKNENIIIKRFFEIISLKIHSCDKYEHNDEKTNVRN